MEVEEKIKNIVKELKNQKEKDFEDRDINNEKYHMAHINDELTKIAYEEEDIMQTGHSYDIIIKFETWENDSGEEHVNYSIDFQVEELPDDYIESAKKQAKENSDK